MATRRTKTSKDKSYKIDFTGVEGEPGRRRGTKIPEGDYVCKIIEMERRRGASSNKPYFSWVFQVLEDSQGNKQYAGTRLYFVTSLQPSALFNLRNLIFAASDGKKNVTGSVLNFNPQALYGKKLGVIVEDDEYEGKIRSKAVDVMPASQVVAADEEEEDEEDEEEYEESEEEEDEEEDEEDDEDDDDELEDVDL